MPSLPPIAFVRHAADRPFYEEAHLAAERLRAMGYTVDLLEWQDSAVRWERYGLIDIQFCADYIETPAAFRSWIEGLKQQGAPVCNPADAVLWNMDKRYLGELEAKGFLGIPTLFADQGERVDIAAVTARAGWHEVVVKPAVSAGGKTTLRFPAAEAARYQEQVEAMLAHGAVLIQAFLPEVMSAGEWSLVFIDGALSHALHKLPAVGEFLVHEHFGGTTTPAEAPAHIRDYGERLLKALPYDLAYARVDGIDTPGGFRLMELEIIEPWLWLHLAPESLERYVNALVRRVRPASANVA